MTLDINFHSKNWKRKNVFPSISGNPQKRKNFSLNCRPKMESGQLHSNSRGTFLDFAANKKHFDSIHMVWVGKFGTSSEMCICFVVCLFWLQIRNCIPQLAFVACRICRSDGPKFLSRDKKIKLSWVLLFVDCSSLHSKSTEKPRKTTANGE